MEFHHISVMADEVIENLKIKPNGIYVDCTLGGAGHSSRIAGALNEQGVLLGIDQDTEAVNAAKERLAHCVCDVRIIHDNFAHLEQILIDQGIEKADGFLFDLGVSSHQIDDAGRGFSYMHDAILDMRMDKDAKLTAQIVVNEYSQERLTEIIKNYGEERWAKRIAAFIAETRKTTPIQTTGQLVDVIRRAIPAAVRKNMQGHPAKRVFQAVRIEVNNELNILEESFKCAVRHLNKNGRLAIITFHSLEDRIAKNTLRLMARGCICPPEVPFCVCGHEKQLKLCGRAATPSETETDDNSRARSAKLRVAEKII
ncbi:16S rRNA (cytosine(1402)-N(4))-methyltransferase RsmH [Pectinatus haikarae]|uniref:16S rRNA (cytosine(1402)-N(4))-methyltransferase RsmH n=1 Tax=Pectinatus haikarae TaxID=349096 RepID=UPI0018C60C39